MKTKNQITLVTQPTTTAIEPKPSKKEIISAMVMAARAQWAEKKKAADEASEAMRLKIVEYIKTTPGLLLLDEIDNFADVSYPRKQVQVTVVLKKDKNLEKLLKEYDALETLYSFDQVGIEEKIKKAMTEDPRRVKALSESPEIKTALDKIQRMFA